LPCSYRREDLRAAELGAGCDLILFMSGELNTFPRDEARGLLSRARAALSPGGVCVLEVHTLESLAALGARAPRWRMLPFGLFSARPHLWLEECAWDAAALVATRSHFIVDAETAEVTRYVSSLQGYAEGDYAALLREVGFAAAERFESLIGGLDDSQREFTVFAARAQ
jgi:hypothetical protein